MIEGCAGGRAVDLLPAVLACEEPTLMVTPNRAWPR